MTTNEGEKCEGAKVGKWEEETKERRELNCERQKLFFFFGLRT